MRQSFLKHWILAAAVLFAPCIADAAGLGRLTVLSALGQPFSAEIELSADRSELPTMTARIAPREAYQRSNLQLTNALAGARVTIERRSSGQHYVKVVTNQPVNEPFLDLLIELTWESGKIFREYTALLDPPGYGQQPSAAAAPAAPVAAPDIRPAPAPSAAPAAAPAARTSTPISGKDYGPIKRGETLSKIAASLKPEGVTLEQMLVGLYRSNPEAFSKNMSRMKAGRILRVPEKDELLALSQKEAAREVRVQAADWRSYVAKLADSAAAAPEGRKTTAGKITARVDEKGGGEPKDVVKLSKGEPPGAVGKGKPRSSAERVRMLEEEAVAREKALKEANERVAQLEKSVQDMKKLAELKSPGMAAAQQAAVKPGVAKPEAAKPEAAKPAAAKPEAAKTSEAAKPAETKPEAVKPEPAKPDAAPAAKPDAAAPAPEAKKDDAKAPAVGDKPAVESKPDAAQPVAEAKKDEPKPKPKPKVVPPPPPPPAPDVMDMVMDNLPIAGGALAVLLGGAGFLFMRRRRSRQESGAEAPAKAAPVAAKSEPTVVMAAPVAAAAAPAAGAPAGDEVDPLAEAEVYIAYGRDTQAEEILKEAMTKDASRVEVPAKLAEIYAARKDKAAFNGVANTVNQLTGGAGEHWLKVAGMGYALDPANPLYAAGKDVLASAPLASETTGTDLDFDLDIGAPAPAETDIQLDAGAARQATPQDTVMLDAGSVPELPPVAEAAPAEPPMMPDFNLELPSEAPPAAPQVSFDAPKAAAAPEANVIDFNIELPPAGGGDAAPAAAPAAEASGSGLDFKLDDISFNLDDGAAPAKEAGKDPHWYDVQQKFDLAKAYQEMGEKDNAREILAEVMKEGDDEQKAQAQKLLEALG